MPCISTLCNCFLDNFGLPVRSTKSKEESELLGVKVEFLKAGFLQEVEAVFGIGTDPDYYKVNDKLLHGPSGKGFKVHCPRTGLPGSSYVDALDSCHTGPATVMLSWTWQYSVRTVVNTLSDWCKSKQFNPCKVYVWQCALCCNQYRVQERRLSGEWEDFDTFRDIFEKRVKTIGHVLAIMAPWKDPQYVTRAWCIFEFYTAATAPGVCLETVCASSEKQSMMKAIADGWLIQQGTCLWFKVDVKSASTTCPSDKTNIVRCIDPAATDFKSDSRALDKLNEKVQGHMADWCTSVMLEALSPSANLIESPKRLMMTALSIATMFFHKNSHDGFTQALRIARDSCAMAKAAGLAETHEYATMFMLCAIHTFFLGDSITANAMILELREWKSLLPVNEAPPGWEPFSYPMLELFQAQVLVAQGRFLDALTHLDMIQAEVEPGQQREASVHRMHYRVFIIIKACALHGLDRSDDASDLMEKAKLFMEEIGDINGS